MEKKRNGFITFYLSAMIIVGILSGFSIIREAYAEMDFNKPLQTITIIIGGLILLNAVGASLLLIWKKIGYWLIVVSAVGGLFVACYLNYVMGMSTYMGTALYGSIINPLLIFGILQIRKSGISCWRLLE